MGKTVKFKPILQKIVDVITTECKTSLGLKMIAFGDLSDLPDPEVIKDFLPGVYVKPKSHKKEKITTSPTYDVQYTVEIFHLRYWAEGETVAQKSMEDLTDIEEALEDNRALDGIDFGSDNISVHDSIISDGDYDDPLTAVFIGANTPVKVMSLTMIIKTRGRQ